jgi:hypothetical protein
MATTSPDNSFSRTVWWAVRPLWVWRLVRLFFRSLWLAALLALAGGLLAYQAGRPLAWLDWVVAGAALFVALFLFLSLWPISARRLTRRLDQHFEFQDQLMAAYEVAGRGGAQNYIETDLLDAAQSSLHEVRRRFIRRLPLPWTDLEMAALVATAAVAVFYWVAALGMPARPLVAHAGYRPLPAPGGEPLVVLPGAPPELQPSLTSQIATGDASVAATLNSAASAQEMLDELAEALRNQTFTETAGEALSQGAIEQAASELRELAQNADALSDEARRDLAESLMAAAEALQDSAPEQAEQLRQMAESLLQNNSNSAAQNAATADALEGLAQLIEAADGDRSSASNQGTALGTGGNAGPQGSEGEGETGSGGSGAAEPSDTDNAPGDETGAGSAGQVGNEEESTGSVESLQSQGVAVPLPESQSLDAGALRPAYDPSQAYQHRSVPYVHVGASGQGGEQPSDPLSIPWRLRNVIQRYFSPP